MELKEIKDTIFELTHIKDEEGNDVPHFCFATDISTDTEETEEEIATIAAKEGYSIYKVFPGETMVGGLVILADGASIDLVKDMYDNFYGEAPEIAKMELNDDEKLVEAEPLEENVEKEIKVRDNPNIEEDAEECPLPLEVIPNNMGINLSNVDKVEWEETDDGQLKELEIKFIPGDDLDEDIEAEMGDEIITDFDKFGDIEAFKKKYEDAAKKLGASIEFKTLVGPYRLDSFWYGSQDIATIHYGDYTIDIYGSDDRPGLYLEDGTEIIGLDELELYGIFNDATFPSDYTDVICPSIDFSIKNKNDDEGDWYYSYSDLDYDSIWDLVSALDIDFYVNEVIPHFEEIRLDESKKKTVKARDPNAQAMWGRTRHRVEMPKKGKGSFKRHSKHRLGEEADLEEAKKKKDNELKARARKHKKSDKKGAMGWFVHPNVETSIQAFNHAMGSADAPSTITAPAGLGEDIEEEPIKDSDLIDFNYRLITDYRTQGYIYDNDDGHPIKSYYYNKVPETCYVVEKDNYLQDTLLRKRKNRRVLNGVKDFFTAHPKSKYCVISAWDISRGNRSTRPINTYRVLAANNISDYFVLRNKKFPKESVIYSSTEKNTAINEYYSKERNIGWELVQIKEGKETKLYPNPEEDMLEAVEKHDTLNPKLWDEDNNLKPEVREKILEIVKEFTDTLEEDEIKFKIKDIVLVGSNCSYNYNEMSDLDIHIRMDTKSLECPDNLYPLLYSAYRSLFNKKFDIDFYGIPVELYIETDDTEQLNDEPIDNQL